MTSLESLKELMIGEFKIVKDEMQAERYDIKSLDSRILLLD